MLSKFRGSPPWQQTVYVMFVAQLITAIGFSTVHPFLPLYVESLGARSTLSVELLSALVFSGQALAMMLASPFWGSLADKYGRKLMVQRSMFGAAVAVFLMAFVTSAEQLVILRTAQGLISGTLSAANALVASVAPRERTGYAMGLLQTGLFGGIALGPLLGGIVADVFGFREAFILTAVLLTAAGLLVWKGVNEHFVPDSVLGPGAGGRLDGWRKILAEPGVKPAYALRFLSGFARSVIWPFIPLFILTLLAPDAAVNTFTGVVVGLASVMSTVTALYLGRLGDNVGHRRILTVAAAASAVLYLLQFAVTEAWQLLVLQLLAGAAFGGIIPSVSALLARYSGPVAAGRVYGLDNSVAAAARSVAPLVGAGLVHWFGLRSIFAGAGLLFLVTAMIAARWLPKAVQTAAPPVPHADEAPSNL